MFSWSCWLFPGSGVLSGEVGVLAISSGYTHRWPLQLPILAQKLTPKRDCTQFFRRFTRKMAKCRGKPQNYVRLHRKMSQNLGCQKGSKRVKTIVAGVKTTVVIKILVFPLQNTFLLASKTGPWAKSFKNRKLAHKIGDHEKWHPIRTI